MVELCMIVSFNEVISKDSSKRKNMTLLSQSDYKWTKHDSFPVVFNYFGFNVKKYIIAKIIYIS